MLQVMEVVLRQLVPKPIVPPLVILSQTGVDGVPAQPQPLAVTTSLVVLAFPSLQGEPGVAGKAGLFGWQSLLLQTPSPSLSPPRLAQGSTGVPAQPQPLAVTTSLVVLALPSLQGEPGVAGKAGLFGWQSLLLQTPSPSESPPALAHGLVPPVTVTVACFSQIRA